ncbi:MAG: peroxiredoxin [Chitinophagaceae bacterium]|nr:peroxiredoxin [Chitinophagaceae bacterium]
MAISKGTKAPDFKLYNTERKPVELKEYAGKLLIINFFPAAFTGVCTEQLCSNRDSLAYYNDLGVAVIGISADMPFSLGAFKKEQHINFELLSDFNKVMIPAYDMLLENFTCEIKGVAKRGVVVIDKDGTVMYSEETVNPGTQVNFSALKEMLESMK